MGVSLLFSFDDEEDFVFDSDKIEFSENSAKLKLQEGSLYPIDNPTIEGNAYWINEGLDNFLEEANYSGDNDIRYILKKDSNWYYWNGTAWVISNGTYAQANTAADILANKASFTDSVVTSRFKAFLHSETGEDNVEITSLSIEYNFGGEIPDYLRTCLVWGYLTNFDGNRGIKTIDVYLSPGVVKYKNVTTIVSEKITVTPEENGYWEVPLIETENMDEEAYYNFKIGNKVYKRKVPDEFEKNFYELLE